MRMPYNVHITVYKKTREGVLYCMFKRADIADVWQGVCGGGESGESIADAALRECAEEGGIAVPGPLYPLDSVGCMRCDVFPEWAPVWGKEVYVLPMYYFAMPYEGEITISDEHETFQWLSFEKAHCLIRFQEQATALWEADSRLANGNIERKLPGRFTVPLNLASIIKAAD
jgi:dATP pyrophosphohydrolase